MVKQIKSGISSLLQKVFIAVSPNAYKNRYLKPYIHLSWRTFDESKVEYEMLLIRYFLKNDSVFFDIGSNIGSFLLIAGEYTAPEHIYGFEPIPQLNARLKKLFIKSHISSYAISDKKVNTQFKIPKINHVNYLTRGTLNTDFVETNESGFQTIDVQTNTLDGFVLEQGIKRIDLMKIDVEGHEDSVIKGGKKTLQTHHPVLIIEIEQRHHQQDIKEIISEVESLGYICCYFDGLEFKLKALNVSPQALQDKAFFEKNRRYVHNFIFIPASKNVGEYLNGINLQIESDRKNKILSK